MDPVVTARVPAGIKARGVEVLHEMGSTTSELVNAAFEYVIKERRLPGEKADLGEGGKRSANTTRAIDEKKMKQLTAFMDEVRLSVPESWNQAAFEELYDQAMEERYANLR